MSTSVLASSADGTERTGEGSVVSMAAEAGQAIRTSRDGETRESSSAADISGRSGISGEYLPQKLCFWGM